MRAVSVPFSPARPSRLKNEPGILPAAYIRSSTSTVSGRKSTSRILPAVAVDSTTVSPAVTVTAPEACLAIFPVSKAISVPPISTATRCTSDICPFLSPRLGRRRGPLHRLDASVVVDRHVRRRFHRMRCRVWSAAMRIVIFGATGYTGRLVADRLVAQGVRPILAGRSLARLQELADSLGGLEVVRADVMRKNSVFDMVESADDVLVSTVGPFVKWGDPAVRAAVAAGCTYLDSTGEPPFIRSVFEEFGPPAAESGARLMTAMGYDFVPGALAGARALSEAPDAVRVDVGYYALGAMVNSLSAGTRETLVGVTLSDGLAFRDGGVVTVRAAERVRSFTVAGSSRAAISVGGAEHFALPAAYPRLRGVNVSLGWFGPLARPMQAGSLAGSFVTRVPGVRSALQAVGERVAGLIPNPEPGTTPGGRSWVAAEAYSAAGDKLSEAHVAGVDGYEFTAGFMAWAAQQPVSGAGALGPVEAFGLERLEAGCRAAGLERVR